MTLRAFALAACAVLVSSCGKSAPSRDDAARSAIGKLTLLGRERIELNVKTDAQWRTRFVATLRRIDADADLRRAVEHILKQSLGTSAGGDAAADPLGSDRTTFVAAVRPLAGGESVAKGEYEDESPTWKVVKEWAATILDAVQDKVSSGLRLSGATLGSIMTVLKATDPAIVSGGFQLYTAQRVRQECFIENTSACLGGAGAAHQAVQEFNKGDFGRVLQITDPERFTPPKPAMAVAAQKTYSKPGPTFEEPCPPYGCSTYYTGIVVTVTDAATQAPISGASVSLITGCGSGGVVSSGSTDSAGRAGFEVENFAKSYCLKATVTHAGYPTASTLLRYNNP